MPSSDIAIEAVLPANSGWSAFAWAWAASTSAMTFSASSCLPVTSPRIPTVSCHSMPQSGVPFGGATTGAICTSLS